MKHRIVIAGVAAAALAAAALGSGCGGGSAAGLPIVFACAIGEIGSRGADGHYVSVATTLAGWAVRNGCAATATATTLPARAGVAADGTSVVRHDYAGCVAGGTLTHLEVVGNCHFWAGGAIRTRAVRSSAA